MKHTNVNIRSPYGPMKYYFEYCDNMTMDKSTLYHYTVDEYNRRIDFYNLIRTDIRRDQNEWFIDDPELFVQGSTQEERDQWYINAGFHTDYIPKELNISQLYLYFPRFSVETYQNGVKYSLDITTYIHGHEIHLGSYLIDRNDVLAADNIRIFDHEEYYEYLVVNIINPWNIIYSDEWREFRQQICGESEKDGHEINSTGSMINISLHPIKLTDTYHNEKYDNISEEGELVKCEVDCYHEIDHFFGGQNSINLADEVSDYLSFHIRDNRREVSKYDRLMVLETKPYFNKAYSQDLAGFREYLKETYDIDAYKIVLELAIGDESNLYSYAEIEIDTPWQRFEFKTLHDSDNNRPLVFDGWDNYHEGMFIKSFLHIKTDDENSIIYLPSNQIAITKDLFRYMVVDDYLFTRTQFSDISEPFFKYRDHVIEISNDNVTVDNVLQIPDSNNHVFVDDMCLTIEDNDPCVMIGSRKITIVGNTFIITDSEGKQQVLQPDESGYIQIDGGQVNHQDDPAHPLRFRLSSTGENYLFVYDDFSGVIEIYEDKVIFDGVSQPVNDAGYVWLKDVEGARFDVNSEDGHTYLSGRIISINNGKIIWGGREQPIYYDESQDYKYRDGKVYIDKCIISKVYLDAVDMKVYNINAVNKVQQNVVKMNRIDDHKTNIIKPVFFRTCELGKVIFHPAVVENICINLDQYKAKVNTFVLRVEGVSFVEAGRTSAGVLFKVDGRSLPGAAQTGLYYILNIDGEMVTSGKYTYEG